MAPKPAPTFSSIASWVTELKKLANSSDHEAKKRFNRSANSLIKSINHLDKRYKIISKSPECE
jgi:hypothetical protein